MAVGVVVDFRRYPYFVDPVELARRRYGVHPLSVLDRRRDIVERGVERLLVAVRRGVAPRPLDRFEDEVLSFYTAAVVARATGSRWIVSRLALAEAERSARLLRGEEDGVVARLARLSGLRSVGFSLNLYREPVMVVNGVPVYKVYSYSLSFVEYVGVARRLLGDDAWRPVNLPVRRGLVYLDRSRMERIVKEALYYHVESLVSSIEAPPAGEAPDWLREAAAKVGEAASKRLPALRRGGAPAAAPGEVVEEAFPPCIREILLAARRGEHLSHHQRFALATFLLNIGAEIDYVVDVFRSMPDFNERITRYQVEHLAGLRGSGKKYRVYSCEKMRSLGLCRADCGTRTPVQAYYRNLRRSRSGSG